MNTSTLPTTEGLKPGDLLTPMECAAIFCEKMRVSIGTYYSTYYPFIKFKYHKIAEMPDGSIKKGVPRIPYEVVIGMIHLITDRYSENDPPKEKLKAYMREG